MTETERFNWVAAHGAALGVGIVTLVFFLMGDGGMGGALPSLALGVILIVIVAGAAWWAYSVGRHEMALGLIVGYAVLSLISGGQCTLLVDDDLETPLNALTGLVGYLGLLILTLLIGGIYTAVTRSRDRGEETEQ